MFMHSGHSRFSRNLHVSSLVGHYEGGGEPVLMVEGAAANWMAHPGDGSIAWYETEQELGL